MKCCIDECEREIYRKSSNGMCRPHYRKFIKYGDPLVVKLGRPLEIRFWEKVSKTGECWEWIGRKNKAGYGIFTIGHLDKILAHRYSWTLKNNVIPKLHVLHRCDNPCCVNPEHLFLGTQADNNADMRSKGRAVNIGRPKLTKIQVREIKDKLVIGEQYKKGTGNTNKLALQYGVSIASILAIGTGRTWKHV